MKKVSKQELNRMKKKGGVKVKRRLGTKLPEPDAKESVPLSGDSLSKAPVLASSPPPAVDMKPFASMAASMAASTAQVEMIIDHNSKVIQQFSKELAEMKKPTSRVPWDHDIIRNEKTGLMKRIRSTPLEKQA